MLEEVQGYCSCEQEVSQPQAGSLMQERGGSSVFFLTLGKQHNGLTNADMENPLFLEQNGLLGGLFSASCYCILVGQEVWPISIHVCIQAQSWRPAGQRLRLCPGWFGVYCNCRGNEVGHWVGSERRRGQVAGELGKGEELGFPLEELGSLGVLLQSIFHSCTFLVLRLEQMPVRAALIHERTPSSHPKSGW